MEFSFLQLTDYNDLYTIAVGLCMAYIIVEARVSNEASSLPFFNFLSQMSTSFMEWMINKKTKPQRAEEQTISRISYYLESGLLTDKIAGALEHIRNRVLDVLEEIRQLEQKSKERMDYHTKADYLHVISFVSFLYGILLLVMGPIESVHYYNVDHILLGMNVFVTLSLMHCIISDKINLKTGFLKPRKLFHTLFFVIVLFVSIYKLPCIDLSTSPYWHSFNIFYGLVMCFVGFIAYTVCSVIGCGWVCFSSTYIILRMSLEKVAKEHADELKRYSSVLEEIDNQLNVGSSDFQINGDSIQTIPESEICN